MHDNVKKTNEPSPCLRIVVVVFMGLFGVLLLTGCVTPGPQQMTILVYNAPNDLQIEVVYHEDLSDFIMARVSRRLWESTYQFTLSRHHVDGWHHEDITVLVSSEDYGEFEVTIPVPRGWIDFSVRLDLETQSISRGYTHGRNLMIMSIWLITLFSMDSVLFFLFRYRKKRSWVLFITINLSAQVIFIGIWSLFHIFISANAVLALLAFFTLTLLIPGVRLAKFVTEIVLYINKLTEHSKGRATAFAIVINLLAIVVVIIMGIFLPLPRL